MNILHIDEQLGWRGGEQQASYLIQGLAERGHTVVVAGRPDGEFVHADYKCEPLARITEPFRGEWDLGTAWRLARAVKAHDIDIIHAHTSHAHTHACCARYLAGRGKAVVSRRVDFRPRAGLFNRWKYGWPDRIIAISQRIRDVMAEFGTPPAKLRVVHSCIDPRRFDVEPLPRAELGVPGDAPMLLNVAALVGHKDQHTLLAAMPRVLERLPSLHLLIAGEGELRGRLTEQIEHLGVGQSVHLLGYRKDVPRLLRTADAFVMSSKEEGLGTSVLDAMACALPVVATAGGGIPEMVANEETGLLVPIQDPPRLADAVVRVLEDRELARRLGENGRQLLAERFTVDRMVEGNLAVYRELLGEAG